MNILTLSIKQKYFDEILAGKKTHEYREIRPTNAKKYITYLCGGKEYPADAELPEEGEIELKPIKYDAIKLLTGAYTGKRPYIIVEVKNAEAVILTDENGHSTEGLTSFRIEDFEGNLKKEYHQEGMYIVNPSVGQTLMEFQLAAKGKQGYSVRKKDNIMNNGNKTAKLVAAEQTSSDRQGIMTRLTFEDKPESDKPLVLRAKMRSVKEHIVELEVETPEEELYYVYGKGGLDSTWTDPAQAVKRADSQMGVVLNRAQQYVWERGNLKTQITLNTEDIPEIIRTGSWDKKVLQDGMGDTGKIIDLSGCSLENVLYEISAQRAVIAKTGENSSTVIVGYDEYNTWLLDPATGEVKPYGMQDSTKLFQKAGNIFITYLEAVTY